MQSTPEIIALLLPGAAVQFAKPQRLVRRADGAIALESVDSREEFLAAARVTGCFRRSQPIVDPESQQIIGYELEEVPKLCRGLA